MDQEQYEAVQGDQDVPLIVDNFSDFGCEGLFLGWKVNQYLPEHIWEDCSIN